MTHGKRVLQALRDGQWHTTAWMYRNGCENMILHSRISSLRKDGHRIEGRSVLGKRGADGYEYRLLPSVTFVEVERVRREASPPPEAAAPPAEQLSLVGPSGYDY